MAYSDNVTEGYNLKIVSQEGSDNFNYVEAPNASRMLGDITGLRVLDLACGSGRFTRWLKTYKQAAEVVGLDMSEDMIEHAREIEKKEALGIHYHVADASEPLETDLGVFDVCFAGYLLHYARDKSMLTRFLQNIHKLLRKGGVFVSLNQNPDEEQNHLDMIQYGFTMMFQRLPPQEGDAITYKCFADENYLCQFDNYYFTRQTYQDLFQETGFKEFTSEPYQIQSEHPKWDLWKQRGMLSVMRAYK